MNATWSQSVYVKAPTRRLPNTPIVVSGSGLTGNYNKSLNFSSVCMSALQALFGRMQLILHSTRRTTHGASCLMQQSLLGRSKHDLLLPGNIEMRGTTVIQLWAQRFSHAWISNASLLQATPRLCFTNVKSKHDEYENTWKCGELKLYVSSSARGK